MEGFCKGEKCNRNGCEGLIREKDTYGGCSCHINPPCGYCTEPRNYCSDCDWDEREDLNEKEDASKQYWIDYHNRPDVIEAKRKQEEERRLFDDMYTGKIPVDKYRPNHKSHTHFSQIIYGVHPNMSKSEIEQKVRGTFGGRFTKFNNYSFEYVAYTD